MQYPIQLNRNKSSTAFTQAKSSHRLHLGHHRFQLYDMYKQVQVNLSGIKKVKFEVAFYQLIF